MIIPLDAVRGRIATDVTAFGFAAAFLESVPIIGLFFSISNRVGAAMWYVFSLCPTS
jgi:hypothetical protein